MRLVDLYWPVAQMVERLTVNQMVAGSSPAGSAILRGVAVVAYQPHKLVVAGSSPAPATMPVPRTERRLQTEWEIETFTSGSDDFYKVLGVKPAQSGRRSTSRHHGLRCE